MSELAGAFDEIRSVASRYEHSLILISDEILNGGKEGGGGIDDEIFARVIRRQQDLHGYSEFMCRRRFRQSTKHGCVSSLSLPPPSFLSLRMPQAQSFTGLTASCILFTVSTDSWIFSLSLACLHEYRKPLFQ